MNNTSRYLTAAEVIRDARTRLILLAGDEPYDPDKIRADSIDILHRRALRAAIAEGDHAHVATVQARCEVLVPLAKGSNAAALYDAIAAGGIGALFGEDAPPAPTVEEFDQAIAQLMGVTADG